jgi:radical SAM superfamily enzyme YgiQ (UPF0313 family)
MGGMHATLLPAEVAEHADSVCTGDAEGVWAQIVADAHAGRLRPRYHAPLWLPQHHVLPTRDHYRGKGYLPLSLLQFGRGCRNRCEFCAVGAYFDHSHRVRPVSEVVTEITTQSLKDLFFVDDNLVAEPEAAKELFRALAPLGVRWVSQVSVDHTKDAELMELMAASGCLGNVIGFESLDPDNLRQMRKGPNLQGFDRYSETVATLRAYHLQTWAAFVLGYDHDTRQSISDTCDWAVEKRFTFAAFNVLMPYPSTPLYDRLQAEGRLLYDGTWWLHPEYRFNYAAFRPARMTADELTEAAWECRQRWSSVGSIISRSFEPHTNLASLQRLALYCAYNPLFRREAFKKQGMHLGVR